ncbi:hypothetical protein K435DRAFT_812478 [Dendrothele bispora CBS 962.96]|uniref:Chromo domain-containing protein n=1 Tax=Dendrothele bispora (strain CBS 962.96) TaxID=1314807 RepID=A0A4S8KP39_DENBC|nr:hypothetical protein K435DRAFT_812478 [Dendrothele bispora CBS 962.96]
MFMEHNHDVFTEFLQVSQDGEIASFDRNNSDREDVSINDSIPEASGALPIEVDSLSVSGVVTADKVVNKQRGQKQGLASTHKLKNTKKRKTDVSANKDGEDSNYQHNEENTSPEEDSEDYEITHIIGHRPTEDGRWEFSVRWKGFIMDSTMVYLEDLEKALRILEAYCQVHPEIDKPPSSKSLDRQESASMLAEHFCPKRLNLLDQALSENIRDFEARYLSLSKPDLRAAIKPLGSLKSCYQLMLKTNVRFNIFNTFLEISPIPKELNDFSPKSLQNMRLGFDIILQRVSDAAKLLPPLAAASFTLDIQRTFSQWERSRSYIVIHDFVTKALPAITDILFHHELGLQRKAYTNRRTGRRHEGAHIDASDKNLCIIPPDIVTSITDAAPGHENFLLVEIPQYPKSIAEETKRCFKQTILDIFIVPHLREPLEIPGLQTGHGQLDGCIVRSAVLSRIVSRVGMEAILCSPDLSFIVDSPQLLFKGAGGFRQQRFWTLARKNETETLRPLDEFLEKLPQPMTRIQDLATHLSDFINHHFLEIQLGRQISEHEYYRNYAANPTGNCNGPRNICPQDMDTTGVKPVTASNILHGTPSFGVLALILRECLNKESGWPFANEQVRRCLDGSRPIDSRMVVAFENPDHWSPVHQIQ